MADAVDSPDRAGTAERRAGHGGHRGRGRLAADHELPAADVPGRRGGHRRRGHRRGRASGPTCSAGTRPAGSIDAPDGVITPGLVNGHRHLLCCAKGAMPEGGQTLDALRRFIYPSFAALTEQDMYVHARHAAAEMIRFGTTLFEEPGCNHLDAVLEALAVVRDPGPDRPVDLGPGRPGRRRGPAGLAADGRQGGAAPAGRRDRAGPQVRPSADQGRGHDRGRGHLLRRAQPGRRRAWPATRSRLFVLHKSTSEREVELELATFGAPPGRAHARDRRAQRADPAQPHDQPGRPRRAVRGRRRRADLAEPELRAQAGQGHHADRRSGRSCWPPGCRWRWAPTPRTSPTTPTSAARCSWPRCCRGTPGATPGGHRGAGRGDGHDQRRHRAVDGRRDRLARSPASRPTWSSSTPRTSTGGRCTTRWPTWSTG